jgi:adenylate kinase family enzyme
LLLLFLLFFFWFYSRTFIIQRRSYSDNILLDRVCGRREDPVTKKVRLVSTINVFGSHIQIYHLTFNPPPLEVKERLTHRSDDTPEKLTVRLKAFHEQSAPIIDYYQVGVVWFLYCLSILELFLFLF